MKKIEPVIEVYYDPNGFYGGKPGAFRARLRDDHGCRGAGRTPPEAVRDMVLTAVSFRNMDGYAGLPTSTNDYQKVRLDPIYLTPIDMQWDLQNIEEEVQMSKDAASVGDLIASMRMGHGRLLRY